MEREMFYFLFLIIFLLHKESTEGVILYIHRNVTMKDARHECESLNGTLARINLLEASDINFLKDCIPEDTSVWIQMVQKLSPWIAIEGCHPVKGLNQPLHYFGTPSVSVCYGICKEYGERFGIMGNECYCGIPEVSLNRSIDNLCANQCNGVFCGGNSFVTVYKKDADDMYDNLNSCQVAQCGEQFQTFRRVPCLATYLPACADNDTDSMMNITTWQKAMEACLRTQGRFLSSNLKCSIESISEYYWIGNFRMMQVPDNIGDNPVMSIRRYKDDVKIEEEPYYENSAKSYLCDTMKPNSSAPNMTHYRANICNTTNFTRLVSMNATSKFAETESSTEKGDKGSTSTDRQNRYTTIDTTTVIVVCSAAAGLVVTIFISSTILKNYKMRTRTVPQEEEDSLEIPEETLENTLSNAIYFYTAVPEKMRASVFYESDGDENEQDVLSDDEEHLYDSAIDIGGVQEL